MALQASGIIKLSDINVEMGLPSNSSITLSQHRAITGNLSGEISLSDYYGKSTNEQFTVRVSHEDYSSYGGSGAYKSGMIKFYIRNANGEETSKSRLYNQNDSENEWYDFIQLGNFSIATYVYFSIGAGPYTPISAAYELNAHIGADYIGEVSNTIGGNNVDNYLCDADNFG